MPDKLKNIYSKVKYTEIWLPALLCILLFSNCSPREDQTYEPERWTSSDPLSIPLRVREQKYKQGNLVYNPSFELGKVLFSDSLRSTSDIEGWRIVGENVRWLHANGDDVSSDTAQVFSGKGCVRVDRTDAGETDVFGNGVLSDYIKVIPGSYQLDMWINLKDIENPKSRLGVRLYDAIDIKLIHYDKNRIKIDADFEAPYYKTRVNNSFKGASLANFSTIDSSGWLHIIGKTHQFPFPDGDLQDDTKFVRIFIGLKGNGSLWVDDVSLKYTRWNFTTLERVKPYFDSTLVKSKLIIPQPRKVEILESLLYYRPYHKNDFPVILISSLADPMTKQAANLLESRIKEMLLKYTELEAEDIPDLIKTKISQNELERVLVFSIGQTDLVKKNADKLPMDKIKSSSKAYFIHSLSEQNVIFLQGAKPIGNYFAAQVCIQLFDEKKMIFHNANVLDYPSQENYALLLLNYTDRESDFIRTAHQVRFCEIYIPGIEGDPKEINSNNAIDENGLTRWIYYPWSWKDDNPDSYNKIVSSIRSLNRDTHFPEGVALINQELFEKSSFDEFLNEDELQQQNIHQVDRIERIIKTAKRQNLKLEIMPELHTNRLLINKLNSPFISNNPVDFVDVPVIWSADQFLTWRVDESDYTFFSEFYDSPKILLDLTLYPRSKGLHYFAMDSIWPYKLQTACLFEAFSNEILPEVYDRVDKTLLGFEIVSVFDRIRLQTASDYFWNPAGYNPDLSLYRALVSEYGEQIAQHLIYFNDYYFKLKSELILSKQLKNINKHQRRITAYLEEIDLLLGNIQVEAEVLNYPELLNTLTILLDQLKKDIADINPVQVTE